MDIVHVFQVPPTDFNPRLHVAACFCSVGDKILFVKRHPKKPQGDTWGLPGGKLEKGETPKEGAVREVLEEVGLQINDAQEVSAVYIRYNHVDYVFHMFFKEYQELPVVVLDEEAHTEAVWATKKQALELPLIGGGAEVLEIYDSFSAQRKAL